ncbi:GNAT family N-acetyltransferase [Glycomyces sp. NPDC047369]
MSTYAPMECHLTTDRLVMRPWSADDAARLRDLHAERGDGTPALAETQRIIEAQLTRTEATGIALLPIRRSGESDFIGYCGLIIGRASLEEPEIAYELFQYAHGHGYATEAARAILDAAAATGRTRLWSTVRTWNTASFRVLEKLGFERDHTTTDDRGDLVWLTRTLP